MIQKPDITPDTPIGEAAVHYPGLIPTLIAKNLDFCCGGNRTLGQAAKAQGLDPVDIVQELRTQRDAAAASLEDALPVWEERQVGAAIDYILKRFHEGHRAALPPLCALMEKVRNRHAARHAFLDRLNNLVLRLAQELEPHLEKEETVLFPLIRRLAAEGDAEDLAWFGLDPRIPIRAMRIEHDGTGRLIDEIRSITHDFTPPRDACASFVGLYRGLDELDREIRLHVHAENNALFPMVDKLLEARAD